MSSSNKMIEVTLPYVRISLVKDFIEKFPKEDLCNVDDIYALFGKSKTSNILPTLQLLKLVNYDKKQRKIKLSDLGIKFRTAIITNDKKFAGTLIKPVIDDIEPFKFIKNLLKTKNYITSEEIGKQLAFKFGKAWNNPLTFKTYGSAVASILSYAGIGTYSRGLLRLNGRENKLDRKPVLPSCSFNTIYKITDYISKIKEVNLPTLINDLGKRIYTEIGVCVELGLIERIAPKQYHISEKGYELVDSLTRKNRPKIWRTILFDSDYKDLIIKLQEKELTPLDLGKFLNRYIGGRWKSELTIKTYGKKFMSWLKYAKLIEPIGKGIYRVKKFDDFFKNDNKLASKIAKNVITEPKKMLHPINSVHPEKETESQELSTKKIQSEKSDIGFFNIGKQIGIITANIKGDLEKTITAVEELILLCEKYEHLRDVKMLIKDHLQLYREIKDNRIFYSDIKLLEKQLGLDS